MVKLLKILALISLIVCLGAPSCGDEQFSASRGENEIRISRESIMREFEADDLTDASLKAYQAAAMQKLSDFPDFIRMLIDTALDITFRKHAGELLKEIFISDSISVQITTEPIEKPWSVSNLIEDGLNNRVTIRAFSIDSVYVKEQPIRIGPSGYKGIIEGYQIFSSEPGIVDNKSSRLIHAEFFLTRSKKVFGSDTFLVWSASLGEISSK